jgi:cysteinyl-tRNA synthetase
VNYSVRKFTGYGKLSGKSLEDLRAGERVNVNDGKSDPLDFVLWKHAREEEAEEVKWSSPWGKGRPGWHLECSAMGSDLLGEHFDIHGGGADLQFPHHENEIAQSEGAHQCQYVNYWMHNGFVRVDDEKMSKSLGNFFSIREVLKKYDAEVVRFFILRAHYRSPLNYSDAHLDDAKGALTRLYTALKYLTAESSMPQIAAIKKLQQVIGLSHSDLASTNTVNARILRAAGIPVTSYGDRFVNAMNDDFNTPEALAVLFDLANEVNRTQSVAAAEQLQALAGILGLLQRDPQEFLQGTAKGGLSEEQINEFIAQRIAAKQSKNYAKSDSIRKNLLEDGIVLEDNPTGTTWRRA